MQQIHLRATFRAEAHRHMIRNALKYVSWKDRKALAASLKQVYTCVTVEEAEAELEVLNERWGQKCPSVYKSWKTHGVNLITFFDFPPDIRRVMYTTNAIESLNSVIRKWIKNRRLFLSGKSALKTIFLACELASKKWTMPIRNWCSAVQHFEIMFEGRITL